jgi:hypothetical protein
VTPERRTRGREVVAVYAATNFVPESVQLLAEALDEIDRLERERDELLIWGALRRAVQMGPTEAETAQPVRRRRRTR